MPLARQPVTHSANGTYHKMTNRKNVVLVAGAVEDEEEGDREKKCIHVNRAANRGFVPEV